MAVDGSTGGGMGGELAEAMTVPSAAAVIEPTGNSISQPSVNIDNLRRYDYYILVPGIVVCLSYLP